METQALHDRLIEIGKRYELLEVQRYLLDKLVVQKQQSILVSDLLAWLGDEYNKLS